MRGGRKGEKQSGWQCKHMRPEGSSIRKLTLRFVCRWNEAIVEYCLVVLLVQPSAYIFLGVNGCLLPSNSVTCYKFKPSGVAADYTYSEYEDTETAQAFCSKLVTTGVKKWEFSGGFQNAKLEFFTLSLLLDSSNLLSLVLFVLL